MAGKMVTEGLVDLSTWYFGNDQSSRGADGLYLGLYTDTTEPPITATLSSGMTELALSGYGRIQLLDADFTIAASGQADNVLKTFTAAVDWGNVYGSFLCNISAGTGGELIAVKHFTSGPFNVLNGKTIDITVAMLPV